MLTDELRARVNAHADREWPHEEGGNLDVNSARAVRRLTFRQGVEWAMAHTADEDLPELQWEYGHLVWRGGHLVFHSVGPVKPEHPGDVLWRRRPAGQPERVPTNEGSGS